ncbi:hypothetical protein BGX38DRAFT_911083 [Terfezia claveryi]|nr:hypothetical protein BGX38DRAFT_911083 [Terfezia claveryi]
MYIYLLALTLMLDPYPTSCISNTDLTSSLRWYTFLVHDMMGDFVVAGRAAIRLPVGVKKYFLTIFEVYVGANL